MQVKMLDFFLFCTEIWQFTWKKSHQRLPYISKSEFSRHWLQARLISIPCGAWWNVQFQSTYLDALNPHLRVGTSIWILNLCYRSFIYIYQHLRTSALYFRLFKERTKSYFTLDPQPRIYRNSIIFLKEISEWRVNDE